MTDQPKPPKDAPFAVGDEVRVTSSWMAKTGDVYVVDAVTDTHLCVKNDNATLCYKRERFQHV